ncbi:RNA polymerase subunit sigma-70 [Maritimibacter sp. 55A14]|nr:RNA polymerase subunit sigma-70 [Maritimibacter sp. 55A14]
MGKERRKSTLKEQIDENLRRAYSETAEEAVPERFLKLLEELRRREGNSAGGTGGEDGGES